MMNYRLRILIEKYISNTCSKDELEEFFLLVKESTDDKPLEEGLKMVWEKTKAYNGDGGIDWDGKMQLLMEEFEPQTPVIPVKGRAGWGGWKRIAVAASIVLTLGLGWWVFDRGSDQQVLLAALDIKAPNTSMAIIKLDDGSEVRLDQLAKGTLAEQGSADVIKTDDGEIVYRETAKSNDHIVYNTLVNPLGSKVVHITLADGTTVWLNAGSTLRFPVAFSGNDRKVSMTGEGYFEVAHDARKPFKVSKDDMEVTVLGTHFNINTYENEPDIKVTLMEGSVKTTIGNGQSAILKPGQQAILQAENFQVKEVDTKMAVDWKDGWFIFEDDDIESSMRKLERWYNIKVSYEGDFEGVHFTGSFPRAYTLADIVKILEATNELKFKVEGREVTIVR
ncbi:FecR family protein [Sphingobacterium lumbrici]|uniref:FecR family protein n=1 Tax=Sphingobacterium lumbrici TaxID=2559600 RepID=UPI00112C4FF9|nr:FecR domain-containing protein [Sphingobacterium lumbrici]